MNPKSSPSVKISAAKEIHAVSKTKTLILRDLPFITQLSRFYDTSKFDKHLPNETESSVSLINNKQKMLVHNLKESCLEDDYDSYKTDYENIENSQLEGTTIHNSNEYKKLYDEMTKTILSEINDSDPLKGKNSEDLTEKKRKNLISQQRWETIRKLRELKDD
jgi:hypothetical protein